MSKISKEVSTTFDMNKSVKQASIDFVSNRIDMQSNAKVIYNADPKFVDDPKQEIKDQVLLGFQVKFVDLYADAYDHLYVVEKGVATKATQAEYDKAPAGLRFNVTINSAIGMSVADYTKLETTEPFKYQAIKTIRDKWNKFKHGQMDTLKSTIKSVEHEIKGIAKPKKTNKLYAVWLDDVFKDIKGKITPCKARGDTSVTPEIEKKVILLIAKYNELFKA